MRRRRETKRSKTVEIDSAITLIGGFPMNKKYDYITFICRVEPPHKAHVAITTKALDLAEKVIIMIGSAYQPRTIKNPWTWREREEMIRACFPAEVQDRLAFFGVRDAVSNQEWAQDVQGYVSSVVTEEEDATVGLIGHKKDGTSFYLDMFPQWDFIEIDNIDDIHSTDIRIEMFENEHISDETIPKGILDYLNAFMLSESFGALKHEYDVWKANKAAWSPAPYEPIFVTVDTVVVQSGHVLLVRRRSAPGKGLWALPGGFLNPGELIVDGAIRELREETKLKVPAPVLKGSIVDQQVFDDPGRSLRGRTITHAFYIELPPGGLHKVKGSDDADKAKWIPLGVFEKMRDQMFEDHPLIIDYFKGK